MHIKSDPAKNLRTDSKPSSSYEWWYFDAVSDDGQIAVVIIFYEGIPFSPVYNDAIRNTGSQKANPENHPAVSISVYQHGKPVYYSLVEYRRNDFKITNNPFSISIGGHRFDQHIEKDDVVYQLKLKEQLPNGDALDTDLKFTGRAADKNLLNEEEGDRHVWNLIQPMARVNGNIRITGYREYNFEFEGPGYHDHNYGAEPMKNSFKEWYWGRVHFSEAVLVYYVMNKKDNPQHRAWLIDRNNQTVITEFDNIMIDEPQRTVFGLSVCRRLQFESHEIKAEVYQSRVVDNGPFYVRYLNDSVLHVPEWGIQKKNGLSEYIYPSRIDWKMFRPLINMRYRYNDSKPHWVQRSPRLYRWTW